MISFFFGEADYIYFVGGLGFFILTGVCFKLWKTRRQNMPWLWLAAYGLVRGINKWSDVFLQYNVGNNFYHIVNLGLAVASLFLLTEFGRQVLTRRFKIRISVWAYVPFLLAIVLAWQMHGLLGANALTRYIFGLGGGLLASWAFVLVSREKSFPENFWMQCLAVVFGLYALTQAVAPESLVFPATVLNDKAFLRFFGFPVAFIRSVLVMSMSFCLLTWAWKTSKTYERLTKKFFPNSYPLFIMFICVIIFSGWLVTNGIGKKGEHEARAELLSYARITASSVNPKDISALSGSPDDGDRPEFRKLKERLAMIRRVDQRFRFVYLMGMKDGKVIFLVDAEPEASDDYSPPGQIYEEASARLHESFAQGKAFIEGPFVDRWGEWVSGFAPIKDPQTGNVLAVVGMDIDSTKFRAGILDYRLTGILFTLTLCIVLIWFASFFIVSSDSALNVTDLETRFRHIFSSAPQAIFILEIATKKILEANPFMCHWLHLSRGEILSRDWESLFESNAASAWSGISNQHAQGMAFTQEYTLKKNRVHDSVPVELSAISLRYEDKDCVLVFMHDITERKKFEEELRKKEEYFRSLTENSLDIITVFKPDGTITYESPSIRQILGYDPQELVGKKAFEFIHPEDLPSVFNAIIQGLRQHGSVKSLEFRFRHKDGSWRVLEGRGRGHLDSPGIRGIVVNSRDITERKQFELELQTAKQYAENLIETANVMVLTLDIRGYIKAFNKTAEEVTGYASEEVLGKNWFDIFVPKDRYPRVFEEFQNISKRGVTRHFENPILTKAGEERHIMWQNNNIFEQGQITGCTSFGMDITQRKMVQDDLLSLLSAVNQSPVSILMTDIKGNIRYCNRKFEQVSGYSAEEVLGKNPRILKSGETSPEEYKALWEAVTNGREWRGELHNRRKDGSLYWESAVIAPLYDSAGKITGFLAVKEDITEKKQGEEYLRETENKFKLAFENSMDALIWADVETGMLVDCNKAAEILFEKPKEEIIGQHQETLHPPGERDGCREAFRKQALGNEPSVEIPIITKAGKIKTVSIAASVVEIQGKKIVQGVFRDVTERKHLEEEAKKRLHELEVFYKASFGREERILELKKRIAELEKKLGERT